MCLSLVGCIATRLLLHTLLSLAGAKAPPYGPFWSHMSSQPRFHLPGTNGRCSEEKKSNLRRNIAICVEKKLDTLS